MIAGITFDFGDDRRLIIAPLSLGTLEAMRERIEKLQGAADPASVSTVIDLAHASLKRNYPSMSREDVAELVDVGNMGDLVDAAMDVSGIRRKTAEAAAGEAQAPSSGAASTPA